MPEISEKLQEIKKRVDKAYDHGQTNREEAADDNVFYWVTHWSGDFFEASNLPYKGEFDVLRKAGRRIIADLKENDVQASFTEIGGKSEGLEDFISGNYLFSQSQNTSIEAFDTADQEIVSCGVGAWELHTEYEDLIGEDRKQVIKRRPIPEANNVMFWDPSAYLKDKSDATYCCILKPYGEEGYKNLVHDLTGESIDEINPENFKSPEHSYTFPWIAGESEKYYVGKFYERSEVKKKIITFQDPFGEEMILEEKEIMAIMDEMADSGFEIISEKTIVDHEVKLYIVSGEKILAEYDMPGSMIPVIPQYGERAIIEGEEHYEGITRLAKGPQILRDFILSYLTDTVSRSPRPKAIYGQEQIAGYEDMYEEQGADDNFPYALMNLFDVNGKELPIGPIGKVEDHEPPKAIGALIDLTRQAIEDVADSGIPQDMADVDLSGKAILALQSRIDMQSLTFQENRKHARRRDAEVYANMAAVIMDTPRTEMIRLPDGTEKEVQLMQSVLDDESGEIITLNDIRGKRFNVSTKIGPNYKSQKEATIDRLEKMMASIDPTDPMRKIIQLKILQLADGVEYDDIRDYARKQLVLMGIQEPETPEEQQLLEQQQQQGERPDPNMVLAQAELLKGQADMAREQREALKLQLDYRAKGIELNIDAFDAITKRMDVRIKAEKANADIGGQAIENFSKNLDNVSKLRGQLTPQNITEAAR